MKGGVKISLRAGERVFINGAVFTPSNKVTLTLLNDARFLLEQHVMQPEAATTPLRRLYFVAQMIIIQPEANGENLSAYKKLHAELMRAYNKIDVLDALLEAFNFVEAGRTYDAMKKLRGIFSFDDAFSEEAALGSAPKAA